MDRARLRSEPFGLVGRRQSQAIQQHRLSYSTLQVSVHRSKSSPREFRPERPRRRRGSFFAKVYIDLQPALADFLHQPIQSNPASVSTRTTNVITA